jgi:transposase
MEAILRLYARPFDPKRPMVCFDEKMTQLLGDVRDPLPLTPKVGRRQDYEYRRGGTRNLFMFVEPKVGSRTVLVTQRRGKTEFAQAMRYLVDTLYPQAAAIDVVLDNLNTHTYLALVETFGKEEADRLAARLCFHYTPPHGSWLNMAEIELSILSRQCLKRRLPDEWTLGLEIIAWENRRNQQQAKIHWRFSVDDARRVFRDRYQAFSSC